MDKHCDNAEKVALYLQAHDKVTTVHYATLPDSLYKQTVEKICINGQTSSFVSFELAGNIETCSEFIDALQLIYRYRATQRTGE